jgi:hypothetical protein
MEWGKSIFIIVIFLTLSLYLATTVNIKTIQENWPVYRCNPLYMPFSSTLAPNKTPSSENFSYCMVDFMKSAAPALTQPLTYVQSMTLALTGSMAKSQEKSVDQQSKTSKGIGDLFKNLMNIIGGMIAQFHILLIKMIDAQGKMMGTITAMMYIVTATQYAFMSMWNGIPGALIKFMGK